MNRQSSLRSPWAWGGLLPVLSILWVTAAQAETDKSDAFLSTLQEMNVPTPPAEGQKEAPALFKAPQPARPVSKQKTAKASSPPVAPGGALQQVLRQQQDANHAQAQQLKIAQEAREQAELQIRRLAQQLELAKKRPERTLDPDEMTRLGQLEAENRVLKASAGQREEVQRQLITSQQRVQALEAALAQSRLQSKVEQVVQTQGVLTQAAQACGQSSEEERRRGGLTAQLAEAIAARKTAEALRDDAQGHLAKQAREIEQKVIQRTATDKQLADGEQQRAALQQQLAQAEQARAKLVNERAALTEQVTSLTKAAVESQVTWQRKLAAAQSDIAQAPPKSKTDTPAGARVTLATVAGRDAYASGFMVGESLRHTLAMQADLGIHPDKGLLLAGVADSINERPQLQSEALTAQYDAMIKRLSVKELARYTAGEKKLAKLGNDAKRLVKRNDTLYFLLNRKGSSKVAAGQRVQLVLTETDLDSTKVLRRNQIGEVVNDGKSPYLIEQAMTLSGIGGGVTVYGFASDVYAPDRLPPGVFGYTVLKYDIDVKALAGDGKKTGMKDGG